LIALLSSLAKEIGAQTYFTRADEEEDKAQEHAGQTGQGISTVSIEANAAEELKDVVISRGVDLGKVVRRDVSVEAAVVAGSRKGKKRPAEETETAQEKQEDQRDRRADGPGLLAVNEHNKKIKHRRKGNAIDDIFGGL
jgi:hypothetical protein